jgi:transposase
MKKASRGDDDSHDNEKNAIIVNRSATNRSEMSQLTKDLRKDRERAERDRAITLRLKHEMQTFDVILAEKAGGKETFAVVCSETMPEGVQHLLSKLAAAIGEANVLQRGLGSGSRECLQ